MAFLRRLVVVVADEEVEAGALEATVGEGTVAEVSAFFLPIISLLSRQQTDDLQNMFGSLE